MKNSTSNRIWRLSELAAATQSTLDGDGAIEITGAAPIESATERQISFVANPRYRQYIATSKASALVLDNDVDSSGHAAIRNPNPYLTFARILDLLYPRAAAVSGIAPSAVIHPGAKISASATIGGLCFIDEGSVIGEQTIVGESVYIGQGVTIGKECFIHPGARLLHGTKLGARCIIHAGVVLGSDGFGYAESSNGLYKIQQLGWVEVGDDVEIGANTTVDRGALGPTKIGNGTKIDNLVQIGHNVEIGRHCVIVSQVGISGSTKIGNGVVIAGQVGMVGHIEIGDGVKIGAQSGVSKSIPPGKVYFGYPAREIGETKRIEASLSRLPELLKRVRELEIKLGDTKKQHS